MQYLLFLNSTWIPFFTAIIGGIIVLIGQSINHQYEDRKKKELELRQIYSDARKIEALMKNNYRELAMYKFHAEYWWHCHITANIEDINRQKYYEKHLDSQNYSRQIERTIGTTKAEYISIIRKFETIKKLPSEINDSLLAISNLSHPKAKAYDISITHNELRDELAEIDETKLREKYFDNLSFFKNINDHLSTQLNIKLLWEE